MTKNTAATWSTLLAFIERVDFNRQQQELELHTNIS